MNQSRIIHHVLVLLALIPLLVPTASAETFVVAFNNDSPDINPGDCICDTSETLLTNCGIRAAIEEANACAGNVIVKNRAAGVRIDDDSNYVRGNHIGVLPGGLGAGNEGNGVELLSSGNVVGGAADTAVNVIANSGRNTHTGAVDGTAVKSTARLQTSVFPI